MSFILDALKRSERERQQQTGAEFTEVPTSSPAPRRNHWLWLLAALLAVNLAVLLGLLMRDDEGPVIETLPATVLPDVSTTPADSAADMPTFANRLEAARKERPESESQSTPATVEPQVQPPVADPAPVSVREITTPSQRIPTLDELRMEGIFELPELRIDIHVYSDNATERFVFINMNKQREQSVLPEGPILQEIRPDGVVLEYRGRRFLLPRE